MERLDVVDKPWEGWELRFDIGTAERSGDVVTALTGAVVERGGYRLGPVDLEVAWADRLWKVRGSRIGWSQGFGIVLDDVVAALCTLLVMAAWRFVHGLA